jgi:alpha-tubulin suppressor-like RCC1 family protein
VQDEWVPKVIDELRGIPIIQVACGAQHSMALTEDGHVFAWGACANGRLGLGPQLEEDQLLPVKIPTFADSAISFIACGSDSSGAVAETGELYTWGLGNYGNLGHGTTNDESLPKWVKWFAEQESQEDVVAVSMGAKHSLAITDAKAVYSWGFGGNGRLGLGDFSGQLVPNKVQALAGKRTIQCAAGEAHSCAVTDQGGIFTWGSGNHGRLGHGEQTDCVAARAIDFLHRKQVQSVSCGGFTTCAITTTGEVYTWGGGLYGKTGHGTEANRDTPWYVKVYI